MPGLIADNQNDRTGITNAQNALIMAILRNHVFPLLQPAETPSLSVASTAPIYPGSDHEDPEPAKGITVSS